MQPECPRVGGRPSRSGLSGLGGTEMMLTKKHRSAFAQGLGGTLPGLQHGSVRVRFGWRPGGAAIVSLSHTTASSGQAMPAGDGSLQARGRALPTSSVMVGGRNGWGGGAAGGGGGGSGSGSGCEPRRAPARFLRGCWHELQLAIGPAVSDGDGGSHDDGGGNMPGAGWATHSRAGEAEEGMVAVRAWHDGRGVFSGVGGAGESEMQRGWGQGGERRQCTELLLGVFRGGGGEEWAVDTDGDCDLADFRAYASLL